MQKLAKASLKYFLGSFVSVQLKTVRNYGNRIHECMERLRKVGVFSQEKRGATRSTEQVGNDHFLLFLSIQ